MPGKIYLAFVLHITGSEPQCISWNSESLYRITGRDTLVKASVAEALAYQRTLRLGAT